jgi:AraC-like DNA-binding protein
MSEINTLVGLLKRYASIDGSHATTVQGLTLYRRSAPVPPVNVVYEPCFCVVAQGAKRVSFGGREYRYDADRYLLTTADLPAMAQVVEATPRVPYLALSLRLDPLEVGELVAQLGPQEERPPARALTVSPLDSELLASVIRLMNLLGSPRDAHVLAPLIYREVTYRLLVGAQGSILRQLVSGTGQGQRITHALRWLKTHYAEPLQIDRLAREARMSPSALHRHFKAVTTMSPLQYQKLLRLHEAKRLMLAEALDAAEASFKVGYESASQFSREYRRLFGAPPRRDVESLRLTQRRAS